eukprot:scaffold25053_cov66-Phaeocystis_antarctica.AAC.1
MSARECETLARAPLYRGSRRWIGASTNRAEHPGCLLWDDGGVEFNGHQDQSKGCNVKGVCLCMARGNVAGGASGGAAGSESAAVVEVLGAGLASGSSRFEQNPNPNPNPSPNPDPNPNPHPNPKQVARASSRRRPSSIRPRTCLQRSSPSDEPRRFTEDEVGVGPALHGADKAAHVRRHRRRRSSGDGEFGYKRRAIFAQSSALSPLTYVGANSGSCLLCCAPRWRSYE